MRFRTGGEVVAVECGPAWVDRLIAGAVGTPPLAEGPASVRLRVQSQAAPFPRAGMRPVTRGAWSDGLRTLLVNACASGFDLLVAVVGDRLEVTARYRPRPAIRAANLALGSRFRLLAGQVLVHYPVLWRAGWRGRVPLHASVVGGPDGNVLLAGPGGVGKSRLVLGVLREGGVLTADNLCAADETRCFGLAEPLRTDAAGAAGTRTAHGGGGTGASYGTAGRRTSYGRVELRLGRDLASRARPHLEPARVVVLQRAGRTQIDEVKPDEAAYALTAGTYAAGELRRYWAFAATLATATGLGPAHPPVVEVAQAYAQRLPCLRLRVGDGDQVRFTRLFRTTTVADEGGDR